MQVTKQEIKTVHDDVARLKGKLDSLFFRMEEAEEGGSDPALYRRYVAAKHIVSDAADMLTGALDLLRRSQTI